MQLRCDGFLADRCIREARKRWEIVDGAYAISFRPDDRLVILTARIYNKASFVSRLALLRAKVKRPLHDQPHGWFYETANFTLERYSIATMCYYHYNYFVDFVVIWFSLTRICCLKYATILCESICLSSLSLSFLLFSSK